MKRIIFILSIVLLSMQFFACKDYVETDIEGQWQLQKIVYSDGKEHQVDTVYFGFKKEVFRYVKLLSEDESFTCFGNYRRDGKQLKVMIPSGSVDLSTGHFDWGVETRTFVVKKHSGSVLELEADDTSELMILRKY